MMARSANEPAYELIRLNFGRSWPRQRRTTGGALLVGVSIFSIIAVAGCGSRPDARTTGFLSSEAELAEISTHELRYIASPDSVDGMYHAMIIDPPVFRLTAADAEKIEPHERAALGESLRHAFRVVLTEDFAIVDRPGSGVARLRVAVTDIQKATPLLNLHPGTRLSGAGAGAAAMEGEVIDSVTGEVLWATVRSDIGPRVGFDGLSEWGDAEAVMRQWAKDLQRDLASLRAENALTIGTAQAGVDTEPIGH